MSNRKTVLVTGGGGYIGQRLALRLLERSDAHVVLFVHGGGFMAGDKRIASPFYANVGRYFAAHGIVLVRFSVVERETGNVAAQVEVNGEIKPARGSLLDENGQALVWFDNNWRWMRQRLVATVSSNAPVVLAIATRPASAKKLRR